VNRSGVVRLRRRTSFLVLGALVLLLVGLITSAFLVTRAAGDRSINSPRPLALGDFQPQVQATDEVVEPRTLVSTVEKFLDALSQGDTAGAMEFVADGAVFQSGLQPFTVGAEAVRVSLGALVGARTELRLLSSAVGGSTVRSQVVVSSDDVRRAGFDRVVWAVNWRVSDGQIQACVAAYDMSDPKTRRYVVLLTAADGSIGP